VTAASPGPVASPAVGTDIHGGIEFRHPGAESDYYDGEPWVAAMDLWPLYDEQDYAAFGCLFGVRNSAGYRPVAADRGLPHDLSSGLLGRFQPWVADGSLNGATWISWADIAAIDPSSGPGHDAAGAAGESRTAGAVLGDGTHWPHVFAVMKALADRFGAEGVRLVVAFD
jgi:hypothetical protein